MIPSFTAFLTKARKAKIEKVISKMCPMKRNNKQLSIRLPEFLLQQLTAAAKDLNETKSRLVKRSIAAYLDYHLQVEKPLLFPRPQNTDEPEL